jgi:hypothetical protein
MIVFYLRVIKDEMNRDALVGGSAYAPPLLAHCHGTNQQSRAAGWPTDCCI